MQMPNPGCLSIGIKLSNNKWDQLRRFVENEVFSNQTQSPKGRMPDSGVISHSGFEIRYAYQTVKGELWLKAIGKPAWMRCSVVYERLLEFIEDATDVTRRLERSPLNRE